MRGDYVGLGVEGKLTGALRDGEGETTECDGFDRVSLGEGGWGMERGNECEDGTEIERGVRSG